MTSLSFLETSLTPRSVSFRPNEGSHFLSTTFQCKPFYVKKKKKDGGRNSITPAGKKKERNNFTQ
eukprot:CAMPEP_0206210160 /NCGR_PEP_ID=MMETSP0166-20121206/17369_1 /ASSEMBLY_ACC=CAM_ASM_000260 /TAXON_ID=95228 /ORGANISM="Vannella robusta, Strain DIVA3 518/3/11/1/6" /LENGTH=64 /DNA_ID=CAMNT_0053631755 /DNA_START=622 /DNA_END=816 /DNA_ORIENTATION=+